MKIEIKLIDEQTYQETQFNYTNSNFLQSSEIAKIQKERHNFLDVHQIQFLSNNKVVGQAIINYQKRFRFFKEAIIIQGPLLDYTNLSLLKDCLEALKLYLKKQNVARFMVQPYLFNDLLNENLEVVKKDVHIDVIQTFKESGFRYELDKENIVYPAQMFIKDLTNFESLAEMQKQFPTMLKRNLKKFEDMRVKVRELNEDELHLFYDILSSTSKRKDFAVASFEYFKMLKKHFKENAKFMLAYLDCKEYVAFLEERIHFFNAKIEQLTSQPETKKTKGLLTDANDKLNSYRKRKKQFDELNITVDILPLSANVYLCYKDEITFILGGSYEEYFAFGGATVLNWDMIQYAFNNNYKIFNFFGTIEVDKLQESSGNFNFKKQFGGNLAILSGTYYYTISPIMKLIEKIK